MRVPPGKVHCNTRSWCEELPSLLGVDATMIQHAEDLRKISSQVARPRSDISDRKKYGRFQQRYPSEHKNARSE